jgi:hypothetical protein
LDVQIKEDEMSEARMEETRMHIQFCHENLMGKYHLEERGLEG